MAVTINGTTGVGVSTTPSYPVDVAVGTLGTTANSQLVGARLLGTAGSNGDVLEVSQVRGTAGTDWQTAGWRLQQRVDNTWMGYIQFNGTASGANNNGISIGTGSSAVSANGVTERLRIDATGNVTATGNVQMASANGGQLAGLRNRIINGDMRVSQRGTVPFTVSIPANGISQYTADRFEIAQNTAATSAVVVGGITSDNALGGSSSTHIYLQTTTAKATLAPGDYALIQQSVEGYNVADLKYGTASAKTVTISFKAVISSGPSTAVISVSLRNQVPNRSYVVPVTITNVAATYSVTIPGDTDTTATWLKNNGVGLRVCFCCGAGSTYTTANTSEWRAGSFIAATGTTNLLATATAAFNITDVQLEVGPVATPFEQRPIGMELALCQRYYLNYGTFHIGMYGTQNAQGDGAFPVSMRTSSPAIAYTDDLGTANQVTVWNGVLNRTTFANGGFIATSSRLAMDVTVVFNSVSSSWLRAYNLTVNAEL